MLAFALQNICRIVGGFCVIVMRSINKWLLCKQPFCIKHWNNISFDSVTAINKRQTSITKYEGRDQNIYINEAKRYILNMYAPNMHGVLHQAQVTWPRCLARQNNGIDKKKTVNHIGQNLRGGVLLFCKQRCYFFVDNRTTAFIFLLIDLW